MSKLNTKRMKFAERQDLILKSAGRLFARWGLRGTTTRAIAKTAKVNEALLFRHYASKEALYEAYLEQVMKEWRREVLPTLKKFNQKPLKQALLGIAQTIIHRVEVDPSLVRVVVLASLEDPHLGQVIFNQRLPLMEFMENFIKQRQKNQELRRGKTALLAATFLSLIFYYIHMKEIFGATKSFYGEESKTLKFFCQIFIEGARPKERRKT